MPKQWWIVFFFCLISFSCGDKKNIQVVTNSSAAVAIIPPSNMRIAQICRSYMQGDFEHIVHLMYNYKDQPQKFKSQLVNMMKQRAVERKKSKLEITQIQSNLIDFNKNNGAAYVYLDISYSDGKQEEIILPMIYDKGNWWIK